jgi:hypothetical protein
MPAHTGPDSPNSPNSTEIDPMVPIMPTERTRPDGGEPRSRPPRRDGADSLRDRPTDTSYASPYTRDEEEIEPFVEDLR